MKDEGDFWACIRDREGTPKNLCDKDFAKLSGVNFLVRFASQPLLYWVVPSNCSEHSVVLFVRFFCSGVLFWHLNANGIYTMRFFNSIKSIVWKKVMFLEGTQLLCNQFHRNARHKCVCSSRMDYQQRTIICQNSPHGIKLFPMFMCYFCTCEFSKRNHKHNSFQLPH